MQEAKQFEVKWRLVNLTTFMYGTKLHFNNDDIYFENPLMPSGTVIHNWYMLTNFTEDRVSPKLPILKKDIVTYLNLIFKLSLKEQPISKLSFIVKTKNNLNTKLLKIRKKKSYIR